MIANPTDTTFETIHALYEADFESPLTGHAGTRTESYFRALNTNTSGKNTMPVWLNFLDSAQRTRQVAIAARMHAQLADDPIDPDLQSASWMTLGHYLRFTAHDHAESAKSYLKAYSGKLCDTVSAALAIIRLWRDDPQCTNARDALATLRRKRDIPTVTMEESKARFEKIPEENKLERANALIDLAIGAVMEWGDAGLALTVLDSASTLCSDAPRLAEVYAAILMAVPDNTAMIDQAVTFMMAQKTWMQLEIFDFEMERLPFKPSPTTLLGLSMMYSLKRTNPAKSAYLLNLCAVLYPAEFKQAVEKQAWICMYAIEDDNFRFALFDSLEHLNDDALFAVVFSHFERFARSSQLRIHARMLHIRYINKNNGDAALAIIQQGIRETPEHMAAMVYDALLYIQTCFTSVSAAKLFDAAELLYEKTSTSLSFKLFLDRFVANVSPDEIELRERIDKNNDMLKAISQEIHSMPSDEIFERCMAFLAEDNKTSCIQTFFNWYEQTREFKPALSLLDAMDAYIGKRETTPSQTIRGILKDPTQYPADTTSHILALALILEPENSAWKNALESIDTNWIIVVQTVLRYLSYRSHEDTLRQMILHKISGSPEMFYETLLNNFEACIGFDELFEQVTKMSESHEQQPKLLEKIDETIDSFSGSTAQKNALYMKKYVLAERIKDDRTKLTCLKAILISTPDDPAALEKLRSIQPQTLKPHCLILYYQLKVITETDPQKRLETQLALAEMYTQNSQLNNALELYHTIIDENPACQEARRHLLDLLKSLGNWKSAENVLLSAIGTETDTNAKYDELVELADIQAEHMLIPSRAMLTLFEALDTTPQNMTNLHPKLCKLSEQIHSFSPLLDKYEEIATHSKDYDNRRAATILLAQVYANNLQKPALACNVMDEFYRRGGTKDPEFLDIFASFSAEIQDWDNYVLILKDMLPLFPDNLEKKAEIALSLAHVYNDKLSDPQNAGYYAHIAADASPTSSQDWLEIADFYINSEPPENAIAPLYKAASLEPDNAQKGRILIEISKLCAELDRLKDAAEAMHLAVRYTEDLDLITPIAESLIALSTKNQNKAIFNQLCTDLISCCPEYEQISLLLEQALTLVQVFDDHEQANLILSNHTEQFNALDVDQSMILAQLLRLLGEHESAIHIIDGIFNNFSLDEDDKYHCLEELLENAIALNDTLLIQNTAENILDVAPDDPDAIFQLMQLDYHAGRWDQAYSKIRTLLAHPEQLNADNAKYMHYYYAEILHAAEHDDLAIESLNNATQIQKTFRQAVDLKLTLLLENQRWEEALPIFDDLLTLTDDVEVQGAIHKRIAELYHFYLNNPQKAVQEYEQALTLGGDVEDVPIRLLQLYQELKLWQKAAMTAQILAMAQVNSPDARTDYLTVLGDIQANHLNESTNAVNTYLEAFSLCPNHHDTLMHLTDLLIERQDWENIRGIFDHLTSKLTADDIETAKSLAWLSKRVGNNTKCSDCLQQAHHVMEQYRFDLQAIEAQALNEMPLPPRKHVHTSPQGSLTVDSALLKNPEIKQNSPESHHSMMTTPTYTKTTQTNDDNALFTPKSPASVTKSSTPIQLPDEALLPIDGNSQRNTSTTPESPSAHTSNFFPTIISRTSSKRSIMHAFETLDFTLDDIRTLGEEAPHMTQRAIDGLLDIAVVTHETHEPTPITATISDIILQALCTTSTTSTPPGINKLLAALVSSEASPALCKLPPKSELPQDTIPDEFIAIFHKLRQLLKRNQIELRTNTFDSLSNALVLNSYPPAILYSAMQLSGLTLDQWTTRMIYALVLTRPENLLCAALTPAEVFDHLSNASIAMSAVRTKSIDLPPDIREQYKTQLQKAGLNSAMIPRITQDTLSVIKQHALTGKKNAIQAAFVLSQNLVDCLQILIENENLRFPTTLSSLKSAMKFSPIVKDFILFSIGSNAQRLYDRIYK